MKVVYVAGPFRGRTHWDIQQNVRRAEALSLEVARLGAMPLVPHKNTENFHGQLDDKFWLDGTLELLRRCDALITVDGWRDSSGTAAEINEAMNRGIRVFHSLHGLRTWLDEPSGPTTGKP